MLVATSHGFLVAIMIHGLLSCVMGVTALPSLPLILVRMGVESEAERQLIFCWILKVLKLDNDLHKHVILMLGRGCMFVWVNV